MIHVITTIESIENDERHPIQHIETYIKNSENSSEGELEIAKAYLELHKQIFNAMGFDAVINELKGN